MVFTYNSDSIFLPTFFLFNLLFNCSTGSYFVFAFALMKFFFFLMLTALLSGALLFVFYCIVETFAFRVAA